MHLKPNPSPIAKLFSNVGEENVYYINETNLTWLLNCTRDIISKDYRETNLDLILLDIKRIDECLTYIEDQNEDI